MIGATQAVLFDLDGTLLDTGRDMGAALNRVLSEMGRPALPYRRLRPVVSQGATGLLGVALGIAPDDPDYAALRKRFLDHYEQDMCSQTRLFNGMDEVLSCLDGRNVPWGVVTNKPEYLTIPLLDALGLLARTVCVVGGDTLAQRKPHPAPLLHGCAEANLEPGRCLYVGDAEGDIQAGRGAGMKTLVATFGYIADTENPEAWGADGMIDHPGQILDWL